MAMNTHTVLIKVKQMGARKVSRQMKGLVVGLASVGLAAVGMARQVIRASDEMTNLGNKSRVFARDQNQAANRMATVVSVARTMNMEMSGVADVMQRVSMSADQVGLSNEQVTVMVSNLAKATKLSGATAQEATGALRQFGQALAANRLSGQELNSILEQTPMIARILADSMGVAVGELRALGKEGKITATVMKDALGNSIEDLDAKFAKFKFPIADQFISLKREGTILIDTLSKLSGAGETLGDAVKGVVDFVTELNRSFATGGPLAQEFTGQLEKLKDMIIALGVAYAGSKLITSTARLTTEVTKAGTLAGLLARIPNPYAKLAAGAVLAAGATYTYFKATSETEKKALKPMRSELENASTALADIANNNQDAIEFWKEHYDMVGQNTEALKEFAGLKVKANQSVQLGDIQVKQGDYASMDDAIDAAYMRQKSAFESALEAVSKSAMKTTGLLPLEQQLAFDSLADGLYKLVAAYDELAAKRQALKDVSNSMAELTKVAITDFKAEYDANWPVDSLMDDLKRIGSTYSDVVIQTGGLTQEQLADMRRLFQGVGNDLIRLIPVSKEFNEVTGDLDTSSQAYKSLEILLGATGVKMADLTAFTKRLKKAQEDNADSVRDTQDLEKERLQILGQSLGSLDAVTQANERYRLSLQKIEEQAKDNKEISQKDIELMKKRAAALEGQQIFQGLTSLGGTQGEILQLGEEKTQGLATFKAARQGDGNMGGVSAEQLDEMEAAFKRRIEQQEAIKQNTRDMETMNNSLLEGELTGAQLREGMFASMEQGFASVAGPALDLGANIASITAAGIGGLSNAITEMATTGKANFKELGMSFLTMITQMIVQMTVMMALIMVIKAVGGEGALALMGLGSRAAGGPVSGGQPYVVGERGPELFVPPKSGSIKSNKETANMMGGQKPQVTIVNVDSAENTLNAMGSEEGENIILNVMQRNPEIMRGMA